MKTFVIRVGAGTRIKTRRLLRYGIELYDAIVTKIVKKLVRAHTRTERGIEFVGINVDRICIITSIWKRRLQNIYRIVCKINARLKVGGAD